MTKYVQKYAYEASQFEDEWIILNTDNYTVTKVNEVGGFCWELLKEAQSIDSIVEALKKNFSNTEDIELFPQEIEEFLTKLYEYGLITYAN